MFLMMSVQSAFLPTSAPLFRLDGKRKRARLCTSYPPDRKPVLRPVTRVPFVAVAEASSRHTNAAREKNSALLLVDHGSKRAAANEMLCQVADMLRAKNDIPVYIAHMEIASPTIADGMQQCVDGGATHIIVVPFFLSPGKHSTTDIPKLAADAATRTPNISYEVRPPIGTHPGIIDIILDRAGLL